MAISYPDWRAALAALLLIITSVVSAQDIPILLDAATTDFDRTTQRLLFTEVSIKRGALGISADQADTSQLDFANSVWVFQGNVKIFSEDASITAQRAEMKFVDHQLQQAIITGTPALLSHSEQASIKVRASRAVVNFSDNALQKITLSGTPAEFEHIADNTKAAITQGSAGRLVYDLQKNKIILADNAWVAQGENEIRGKEIAYDISAQRIIAGGEQDGDRVKITITPPPAEPDNNNEIVQ